MWTFFTTTAEINCLKEPEEKLGKGIITFSPLEQGLLTDRYLKGVTADSRIMADGRFLKETALTAQRTSQIRTVNDLAAQRGQILAQMALAWILRLPANLAAGE